jgi:hypothetical protein
MARKNATLTNKQAQILGAEMDAMEKAGIAITPASVLKRVGKPEHPLYSLFEWDDAAAAVKWRLSQARAYIAEVEIVVKPDTGERGRARLSVVVVSDEKAKRSYQTREIVEADDGLMHQVSVALYARVVAAVREARSLGLTREGAWRRIDDAVSSNEPSAVQRIGGLGAAVLSAAAAQASGPF